MYHAPPLTKVPENLVVGADALLFLKRDPKRESDGPPRVVCAGSVQRRRRSIGPLNERPKLPHYDPDYCLKVVQWTAFICVAVLAIELLVLITVDPSAGRCPGWIINATKQSAASLWVLVGIFTALPTIWICYVVFRWDYFSQKLYGDIAYRRSSTFSRLIGLQSKSDAELPDLNFENIFLINFDRLFLRVSIVWCLFCTGPLWMMLANCTSLSRYLGY